MKEWSTLDRRQHHHISTGLSYNARQIKMWWTLDVTFGHACRKDLSQSIQTFLINQPVVNARYTSLNAVVLGCGFILENVVVLPHLLVIVLIVTSLGSPAIIAAWSLD